MSQRSLLPVNVVQVVPSAAVGVDGADLKWIARGDDGYEYAMKTVGESPTLPLSEWVCYALWGECGLPVPECAVLSVPSQPPAFGSRIELQSYQLPQGQVQPMTITQHFVAHRTELGRLYPADAFLPNNDRHGRNVLFRRQLTGSVLVSIDFSRAWLQTGQPFGDITSLDKSNTQQWWHFFRDRMNVVANHSALETMVALPDAWMRDTLAKTPPEWSAGLDVAAICDFWKNSRAQRAAQAKMWL